MRTFSTFLAMSLLSCVGCDSLGGGPHAAASASAASGAATVPGPSTAAPTAAPAPAPTGPAKWSAFTGPAVTVSLAGPKAWALVPVAWPDFATAKIARLDWVEARGNQQLFRFMSQETLVPNAATAPSKPPAGLAPGAPVVVAANVTSVPGRVVSVGPKLQVRYRFAGNVEQPEVAPEDVLPITGKLAFGVPVAYREGGSWHPGQLVTTSGDALWLIGFGGLPKAIPAADVVPIDAQKRHAKGAKVSAAYAGKYYTGPVVDVLDDGLAYKVDVGFPFGEVDAVFSDVSSPLP